MHQALCWRPLEDHVLDGCRAVDKQVPAPSLVGFLVYEMLTNTLYALITVTILGGGCRGEGISALWTRRAPGEVRSSLARVFSPGFASAGPAASLWHSAGALLYLCYAKPDPRASRSAAPGNRRLCRSRPGPKSSDQNLHFKKPAHVHIEVWETGL